MRKTYTTFVCEQMKNIPTGAPIYTGRIAERERCCGSGGGGSKARHGWRDDAGTSLLSKRGLLPHGHYPIW